MQSDNVKTGTAQERDRRDRVRLVRRLSKWLTRADGMAADAAKMKRDGVAERCGWPFAYADFFALTGALRKYLKAALEGATGSSAATAERSGC